VPEARAAGEMVALVWVETGAVVAVVATVVRVPVVLGSAGAAGMVQENVEETEEAAEDPVAVGEPVATGNPAATVPVATAAMAAVTVDRMAGSARTVAAANSAGGGSVHSRTHTGKLTKPSTTQDRLEVLRPIDCPSYSRRANRRHRSQDMSGARGDHAADGGAERDSEVYVGVRFSQAPGWAASVRFCRRAPMGLVPAYLQGATRWLGCSEFFDFAMALSLGWLLELLEKRQLAAVRTLAGSAILHSY